MPQKSKNIRVSVINPPAGHQDTTSLAHAKRYVRDGKAHFVPGQNAIEFGAAVVREIAAKMVAHVGPPINACTPTVARVSWPAQFSEIMGDAPFGMADDPTFLVTFLNQGGIGMDQRTVGGHQRAA